MFLLRAVLFASKGRRNAVRSPVWGEHKHVQTSARPRAYHIAISYLTIAQDGFWHADPNPWQQCPATVHSASHPGSSLNRSGVDTTPTTSTASATIRIILGEIMK